MDSLVSIFSFIGLNKIFNKAPSKIVFKFIKYLKSSVLIKNVLSNLIKVFFL